MMGLILRFDKVAGSFLLDPERPEQKYPVPISRNPKHPNYIRVQNGKISFHWSDFPDDQFHSKGHGHFWQIPAGATAFQFPHLRKSVNGWHYGVPKFFRGGMAL